MDFQVYMHSSLGVCAVTRQRFGMAFDGTDFVDSDYSSTRTATSGGRAPTREELDAQLTGTQQQLAKLREAQDQLERARAAVEEMRRRRSEFTAGRTEMLQSITRGIGVLQKAEHEARQNAEQMSKSLVGLRTALVEVEHLNEQAWTSENWEQELTRSLTTIENARMEFSSARLAWPILDGKGGGAVAHEPITEAPVWSSMPLGQLFKLGLALTWPLVLAVLLVGSALVALLNRH